MELKIRKIMDKVEIDTETQGCWSDCHTGKYVWSGFNKMLKDRGASNCKKKESMSAHNNIFL